MVASSSSSSGPIQRKQSGPIVVVCVSRDALSAVRMHCLSAAVSRLCLCLCGFLEHINYYYKNIVVNIEPARSERGSRAHVVPDDRQMRCRHDNRPLQRDERVVLILLGCYAVHLFKRHAMGKMLHC